VDEATRTSIKNAIEHGFEIVRDAEDENVYTVKDMDDSASGYPHIVTGTPNGYHCDCKSYEYRGHCKHIRALNLHFLRSGSMECAQPYRTTVEE